MITINISEETSTKQDMVYLLQNIAKLIEDGYTSGVSPTWDITGDEELDAD